MLRACVFFLSVLLATQALADPPAKPRNVIIFVADGLRGGIVDESTAPALAAVKRDGVSFPDSHSLFPTVTTVNASAIATGHLIGDTGDFSNVLYVGARLDAPVGSMTASLEDDQALAMINQRYGGNYLGEVSLLAAARQAGYATAVLGKAGPSGVQDIEALGGAAGILIDDNTGWRGIGGASLPADLVAAIKAAGLSAQAPDRGLNTDPGTDTMPGVRVANVEQQDWFADVAAKVLLPRFAAAGQPFVLIFWSRDPDGTQHGQGDSLNTLTPGINGPTSLAAIRNASNDLQRLQAALSVLGLADNTDIFVTADHGFSTVSKESRTSGTVKRVWRDVPKGFLPPGFLALDLAAALKLRVRNANGLPVRTAAGFVPHGGVVLGPDPAHPLIAVASNGGMADLWLNGKARPALARRVVAALIAEDYVSGVFVDDDLGPIPGTLPMSLIGMKGSALTPRPAIMVGFRSFGGDCAIPTNCVAEVADTEFQQGQGIHGAFHRGDTFNFMAAIGPDFKAGYVDPDPVSNADVAPTLEHILGLAPAAKGKLTGRVLSEALNGGPASVPSEKRIVRSDPGPGGFVTQLDLSEAGGETYADEAGAPGRTFGLRSASRTAAQTALPGAK
jgi:type I phosphodiesterase/nucleotide pyrophosphatase